MAAPICTIGPSRPTDPPLAMLTAALVVGILTFVGTALGSLLGGLGMDMGDIAAASVLATLLGLVFGGIALALSAATGRVKIAVYGTTGLALSFYLLNSFLPLNDSLAGYAKCSPFYYYLTSDPLNNGMHWGHAGVLAARQKNTLESVPDFMRTPCFFARYIHAPAQHLENGLPIQEWDATGYRRSLVDFDESRRVSRTVFSLPTGYDRFSLD